MNKRNLTVGIAVTVALAVVSIFFIFGNPFASQSGFMGLSADASSTQSQPAQLIVQDEVVGTGAEVQTGNVLLVNYTGKLSDGTVFDTSVGKQPIAFVLGAGQVIPGWDQGLQGMKVGGKRLLIIPPSLAYGSQGRGAIPPNATLIFEVQLMGIAPAGQTQ